MPPPDMVSSLEATVHQVLAYLDAELADLGLSHGEVNALAQLDQDGPMTVAQLQAATGQRASTMTGVLDRLERRGLITRTLNARDRRSFMVAPTATGLAASTRIRRTFADLEARTRRITSRRSLDGYFEVLAHLARLTTGRSRSR